MYFSVYNIKNNKMKFIYISLIALSFCVLLTEAKLNVTVSEQKDIEVIYAKLKSKNSAMSVSKLRSKYENEFKLCDENHNGYLSRKEFINCVHNNTNSFANLLPSFNNSNIAKHLRLHGIKSENDYINRLYDLFAPKTIKITFYIYMTIVLYNSSFDNCQNVPFFIYEKKFECLVDYVVPYKTLPHGTLKTLFDFGINLSPNREERYLDVPTFILLSLSIRLFGKVNIRNNYMVSKAEMNHAYDNGRLPIRYNKEMIDDIFDLVEGDEMNVHSFVFYDIILKIYKCYNSGRNNQMTLKEMTMSLKHIYFPRRYLELLKKKDAANKIIKKINKIKRKLSNSTEKERNSTKEEKNKTESLSILDLSFKMLSYKNEKKFVEFPEYARFIRFFYLYRTIDKRNIGKVKVWKMKSLFQSRTIIIEVDEKIKKGLKNLEDIKDELFISPYYSFSLIEGENIIQDSALTKPENTDEKIQIVIKLSKVKKLLKTMNLPYESLEQFKTCEVDDKSNYNWTCVRSTVYNYILPYL